VVANHKMMLAIDARPPVAGFGGQRGPNEDRTVHEQTRDQAHLDPEGQRRQVCVEVGQHQQCAADDNHRQAGQHDAVYAM
jgi:hypothetical protein